MYVTVASLGTGLTAQLLGTLTHPKPKKGACRMSNGVGRHLPKDSAAPKQAASKPAPAAKPNSPHACPTGSREKGKCHETTRNSYLW